MKDAEKTKEQLLVELADLQKHVSEQEAKLKDLRESEERYRSLIDNAHEAIVVAQDGLPKFFNARATELIGYLPEEFANKSFLDVIHPDDRQMLLDRHLRRLKGEEFPHVYPIRIIRKDGDVKWLELNAVLISWNGKPATLNFLSDVTERTNTEEALRQSEEKLRLTFESIEDSIILIDPEGRVLDVNEAAIRIAGFKNKQQVIGINAFDIISPKDRERVMKSFKERQSGRLQRSMECAIQPKRGKKDVVAEITASPLRDTSGKLIGYIAVLRDITERKRIENALRASEEKLRLTFESIKEGISITDLEGRIVTANEAGLRMSGYTRKEDIIGRSGLEFIAKKDRAHAIEDLGRQLREGRESTLSYYTMTDKNGNEYYGEISAATLPDVNGNPIGFIAVARDITERKLMEKALLESGEKLSLIFESIKDGIILIDLEGNIVDVNEATVRMSGYSQKEEIIGRSSLEFVVEKERSHAIEDMTRQVSEGRGADLSSYTMIDKNGKEFAGEVSATILPDSNGHPAGYIAVVRDVTERRQIEGALRESEEKLRLTFESIQDGIILIDLDGKVVDVNEATVRMGGYRHKDQVIGRNAFEWIAPKDRSIVMDDLKDRIEGHPKEKMEYSIHPADGRPFEAELTASMLRDEGGNPTGYIAVIRDISERKKTEDALRESEKRYRLVAENVSDVIWIMDMNAKYLYISPSVERMRGYTPEEMLAMPGQDFVTPESAGLILKALSEEMTLEMSGKADPHRVRTLEMESKNKDGATLWQEVKITFMRDQEGKPIGFLGVSRDIDERKRTEEALKESEQKYKDLVEQERDVIFSIDADGRFTSINTAVTSWGYMPEEIVGQHYSMFLPHDLMNKLVADLTQPLMKDGEIVAEAMGLDRDGNWRPIEFSAMLIMKDDKFAGARGIVRDIKERKRAEEALKQRNRELATLNRIAEAVSHPLGLNKVLRTALDSVLETMDFTGGCIWLLDKDSSELELVASRVPKGMPIGVAMVQEAFKTGEVTTVIHHPENQSGQANKGRAVKANEGKSIISIPLKSKGETLGVLGVVGPIRMSSPDDIRLLETVGDQIAVAVENAQLLDRLNELSITDELTGLFNRRHFYKVLESETDRTRRYGRCISLAMIDLDGFKKYNDKFGHASGDVILADFAKVLTETLRKTDTAFRYGGDEFIVILPATNAEKAKEVIERISKKWLKQLAVQLPLADIQLGFSAGIAQFPENAETVDGLVFLSDTALYYAKRGGGQKVMLISDLGTSSLDVLSASTLDQVYALAATVDTKDPYTYGHSKRTAAIAESLGKAIGIGSEELSDLTAAAFLHDIGKVGIADMILTKPGKPKKEEWEAIKKHCAEGAKIVQHVKELMPLAPIILHHHEWYDGTGYPDGLKGEEIPLHARIISVADAYDTMTAQRSYHEGVSPQKALEELERCSGTQFDPQLIKALRRITGNESVGDY